MKFRVDLSRSSVGPDSEKSVVYYGQIAHTCDMQFYFGCLRFFYNLIQAHCIVNHVKKS